ncbi:MAG: dockerin type I domain-containing protein [Planctomycetota bacterium]|nr:dockerin type I domain-containing protein [Planctomycetota bacterium]
MAGAFGRLTKFDDLGRQVATVENASAQFDLAQDITWQPGANGASARWAVNPARLSASDANRVTSYVYDASGNIVRMVAHAPGASGGERVQVTEYEYGTTAAAGGSTDPMASLVASEELLSAVRYPDESTGLPGAGDAFTVRYAYNRLGELRATTDQNGTRHEYQRDAAGRVTRDSVGALGAGIDGAVRAISVSYDAAGRMLEVRTATDELGANSSSGVGFTYTPLWQVASVVQHPTRAAFAANGTPAAGSRSVSYAYATVLPSTAATPPATGDNFSRLSTTTYPTTSTVVTQTYASGLDARLSRVSGLSLNSPNGTRYSLAAYRRLGMDTFAVVDYPAVDIQLDRTWSPSDRKRRTNGWTSQAAGVYPGLDRFGRVVSQSWLDGVTGSTAAGYRPAIVDQIHIYDLASNRLSKRDGRAGASWLGRDWEYSYDGLDRLTEARQGARVGVTSSSQGTWIPAAGGQEWVLDMLGNWTEQRTDLTGNGVFTDATDRSDARSHNLANELTQRVVSPTAGGTTSTNSVTLPLAYDAAGNLEEESTSASTKRRYTHDAWGRLVKVESLDANNAAKPLSTHRFNGLHWRIEKHWHAVADAADLADRKTTFWYDAAWRVVQETQRDQTNGAGTLEESIIQQVWGARYIDDAVARMRVTGNGSGGVAAGASQELAFQLTDAQFSVIAVATPGKPGVVIDRIAYSPYGEATRTLRSDVNGDGFVNQSDYSGIIKPRIGATIGTATYVVEADLDRNGIINQLDYDISIADDGKSSSGGVGEAGLFSRGVRNSLGYCGYVYNEDSGLYTVRFRTYSPTLGRWLERDPAGYVDGANTYQTVHSSPVMGNDPLGLYDVAGHFWTTYLLLAQCKGIDPAKAMELAYFSQLADIWGLLDAIPAGSRGFLREIVQGDPTLEERDRMIAEILHSLHGGDAGAVCDRRRCLAKALQRALADGKPTWQIGIIIHAFGDSFAHTKVSDGSAYSYPLGHSEDGTWPDVIGNRRGLYRDYCDAFCRALGGKLDPNDAVLAVPAGEAEDAARARLERLARTRRLPMPRFDPGLVKQFVGRGATPPYGWPRREEVYDYLRELQGQLRACENEGAIIDGFFTLPMPGSPP